MLDGKYTIMIDTPLGKKAGNVVLRTEGDKVYSHIDAPVIGKQEAEATADGDTFTAEGTFKLLLVGKIEYSLRGEVEGDNLHIALETSKGNFDIEGTRE